jgi:hypothetical protein
MYLESKQNVTMETKAKLMSERTPKLSLYDIACATAANESWGRGWWVGGGGVLLSICELELVSSHLCTQKFK